MADKIRYPVTMSRNQIAKEVAGNISLQGMEGIVGYADKQDAAISGAAHAFALAWGLDFDSIYEHLKSLVEAHTSEARQLLGGYDD
jgi:hypothetical protein